MLWFPFCKAIWNLFSFSVFFPDSYLWSNLKGNCNLNNDQERICCNLNIVSLASDETNIFTQNHRIWAWMKCDRVGFVNPPAQSRLSSHRSPRIMCSQILISPWIETAQHLWAACCQCLTILTIKWFFVFTWNFLIFFFVLFFSVCTHYYHWTIYPPTRHVCTLMRSPAPSLLWAEYSHLSLPLLLE